MSSYEDIRDWIQEEEEAVTVAEEAAVRAVLKQDRDVIVDAMHLRPRYLRRWKRIAEEFNAYMEVVEFPTDLEECIRRDAQRENPVGEEVIRGLARKYMPKGGFLPVVEPDGPGTLEPYVHAPASLHRTQSPCFI